MKCRVIIETLIEAHTPEEAVKETLSKMRDIGIAEAQVRAETLVRDGWKGEFYQDTL